MGRYDQHAHWITTENIARFEYQLTTETDICERKTLEALLVLERDKLKALGAAKRQAIGDCVTWHVPGFAPGQIIPASGDVGNLTSLIHLNAGTAMPLEYHPASRKGLGMRIIQSFGRKIGGESIFARDEGDQGARISVLFPWRGFRDSEFERILIR